MEGNSLHSPNYKKERTSSDGRQRRIKNIKKQQQQQRKITIQ